MANQAAVAAGANGDQGSMMLGQVYKGLAGGMSIVNSKIPSSSPLAGMVNTATQNLQNLAAKYNPTSGSVGASVGSMTGYVSKAQRASAIVSKMKANSAAWATADNPEKLAAENERYASQVSQLLGVPVVKSQSGVWYLDHIGSGEKLYQRYHTGGIVGGYGTLRDNEAMAVLQNGEAVISNGQKKSLYRLVDTAKEFGGIVSKLTSLFGNDLNAAKNHIVGLTAGTMSNINRNRGGDVSVDASVNINGDITSSNWERIHQQLKEHQKQVAEIVNRETISAYNRRGVAAF